MVKPIDSLALFRLQVLGPLVSRGELAHGELKSLARELSSKRYQIPGSRRTNLSEQTILRWYYNYQRNQIEGLTSKFRSDKGKTQLPERVQVELLKQKKENPARSINTLIQLLEQRGLVRQNQISRASVHRFLKREKLSKRIIADSATIERRSFVAVHAGDIFHGDVLHGPRILTPKGMRKTYLVSLLDDASRLIAHSAFCFGETALDIEGVLKQAVLKRGLPYKLIIDNGPAYRAETLQTICALLQIRLIYCRPYEPEGKGKLERFHRTFREQFLNEIEMNRISGLEDLNARLWAWTEQIYHQRKHDGLQGKTPINRWREDLVHVRPLGLKANKIDDIFCHRYKRLVRRDGTVSWDGKRFEVSHGHVDETVNLVVDPHTQKALHIESMTGDDLGRVTLLDPISNLNRTRQRPHTAAKQVSKNTGNTVEFAYQEYSNLHNLSTASSLTSNEEK